MFSLPGNLEPAALQPIRPALAHAGAYPPGRFKFVALVSQGGPKLVIAAFNTLNPNGLKSHPSIRLSFQGPEMVLTSGGGGFNQHFGPIVALGNRQKCLSGHPISRRADFRTDRASELPGIF